MPKPKTGKPNIGNCYKLDIQTLTKAGVFRREKIYFIADTGLVITITYKASKNLFHLEYNYNGKEYSYFVLVHKHPTNYASRNYFVCPVTGGRVTALYMMAEGGIFKSRWAFDTPLLYHSQTCSRHQRSAAKLQTISAKLEDIQGKRAAYLYRGNVTKRYVKQIQLSGQQRAAQVLLMGQFLNMLPEGASG